MVRLARVPATLVVLSAACAASEAPTELAPATSDGAVCSAPTATQRGDLRYAARVSARVVQSVNCGGDDVRLVLEAEEGDFHGAFVGRRISMTGADGGPMDPAADAETARSILRARPGDRVEVDLPMYPTLTTDGRLASPGSIERIRLLRSK